MLELPLSLLRSLAGPLTIQSGPLTLQTNQFLYLDGTVSGNPANAGLRYNSAVPSLDIFAGGAVVQLNVNTNVVSLNGPVSLGNNQNNLIRITGAANGSAPTIAALGSSDANVSISLVPKGTGGLRVPTGGNGIAGVSGAMTAGSVTVNTGAVTASSVIMLTRATAGGTVGSLAAAPASIVAGASFVITSSSGTDTSTVFWLIIN